MYKYIFDPKSNTIINIRSKAGKITLYKYLSVLYGGSTKKKSRNSPKDDEKSKTEPKSKTKSKTDPKPKLINIEEQAKQQEAKNKELRYQYGYFEITRENALETKRAVNSMDSSEIHTLAQLSTLSMPLVNNQTEHKPTFISDLTTLVNTVPKTKEDFNKAYLSIQVRMKEIMKIHAEEKDMSESRIDELAREIEILTNEGERIKEEQTDLIAIGNGETHRLANLSTEQQNKLLITPKQYLVVKTGMMLFADYVREEYTLIIQRKLISDLKFRWLYEKKKYFFDKHIIDFVNFWSDPYWKGKYSYENIKWLWLGRFMDRTLTPEYIKWHKFFFIKLVLISKMDFMNLLLELNSLQTDFKTIFQNINKLGEFPDEKTKLEDYLSDNFYLNDNLKEILLTILAITFMFDKHIVISPEDSFKTVEKFLFEESDETLKLQRLNLFIKMFPVTETEELWEKNIHKQALRMISQKKIQKTEETIKQLEDKSEEIGKSLIREEEQAKAKKRKEEEEAAAANKAKEEKEAAAANKAEEEAANKKKETKEAAAKKAQEEAEAEKKKKAESAKEIKILEGELQKCGDIRKHLDILVRNQSQDSLEVLKEEMKKLPEDLSAEILGQYEHALGELESQIHRGYHIIIQQRIDQNIKEISKDDMVSLPSVESIDTQVIQFNTEQLKRFKETNEKNLQKKLEEMRSLLESTYNIKEKHKSTNLVKMLKKYEKKVEELETDLSCSFKPAHTQKDTPILPLKTNPFINKDLHLLIREIYDKGYPYTNIVLIDGANFLSNRNLDKYREDYSDWKYTGLTLRTFYIIIKEESLINAFQNEKQKTLEAIFSKIYGKLTNIFNLEQPLVYLVVIHVSDYSPEDGVTTNCLNGTGYKRVNKYLKKFCELYDSSGRPIGKDSHEACGYDDMLVRGMTEWTLHGFSVMQDERKLLTAETIGGLGNWRDTSLAQELFDRFFAGAELDFKVCIYQQDRSENPDISPKSYPSKIKF